MQDLFGMQMPEMVRKVVFTDAEVDDMFDHIIGEGELLKDMASNLEKLKSLEKGDLSINQVRKAAWNDIIWAFGLDEPSPVPFDVACDFCGVDSDNIRAGISREFGDEVRLMHQVICAQLPHLREKLTRHLGRFVSLATH